jgi:hypothetical protein
VSEECIIALPSPLSRVTQVRSTLIQSSLNTLRQRGHYERYLSFIDPREREIILGTLAPVWLELSTAMHHYEACDRLALDRDELMQVGEDVGNKIQGTFIGTIVKKARTVGLNPWVPLANFHRLWERLMQGGGVSLTKVGPKDARIEVRMLPLARYAYFRAAFCGVIASGIKLGAGRAVGVRQVEGGSYEDRLVFRGSWV